MFTVILEDGLQTPVASGRDAKECLSNLIDAINSEEVDTENFTMELVDLSN